MTLRKLRWAMLAKRREEWKKTTALMSWLALCFNGEKIDPDTLNPYIPPRVKSKEERKLESEEGFALLKAGLRQFARSKGKQ